MSSCDNTVLLRYLFLFNKLPAPTLCQNGMNKAALVQSNRTAVLADIY